MKKPLNVVHIHRAAMGRNVKCQRNAEPVIIARRKSGRKSFRSNNVAIVDADGRIVARVVADVKKPLSCGARAYVETELSLVDGNNVNNRIN